MARSRNIKPSFFQNEQLGELTPIERLAFIGMWTIADFKGCLEFRPKRLKIQLMPYDECDFEKIAINLDKSGLIRNYSVQGQRYIKIVNFVKHQNPHKNERQAGSDIPDITDNYSQVYDFNELAINTEQVPNKDGTNRADSLLLIPSSSIPDSLLLNPDSGFPLPDKQKKTSNSFKKPTFDDVKEFCISRSNNVDPEAWIAFYESNGWKVGKNPMKNWKAAVITWEKQKKETKTFSQLKQERTQKALSDFAAQFTIIDGEVVQQ